MKGCPIILDIQGGSLLPVSTAQTDIQNGFRLPVLARRFIYLHEFIPVIFPVGIHERRQTVGGKPYAGHELMRVEMRPEQVCMTREFTDAAVISHIRLHCLSTEKLTLPPRGHALCLQVALRAHVHLAMVTGIPQPDRQAKVWGYNTLPADAGGCISPTVLHGIGFALACLIDQRLVFILCLETACAGRASIPVLAQIENGRQPVPRGEAVRQDCVDIIEIHPGVGTQTVSVIGNPVYEWLDEGTCVGQSSRCQK
ncbi:MAG: hypothetical protein MJZ73_09855 [Bacteroidaceae bacterium]|nr:hypothetical protein [Bacteroidaceae bacterium]